MPTNNELIQEWCEWLEFNEGQATGTVSKYRKYLRSLAEWLGEAHKVKLPQADQKALEEFAGIVLHGRKVSPRSRRPWVAAIRGFYNWAEKQWYVQKNPAKDLPYPAAGLRLPKPMALQNAEKLLMQPNLDEFTGIRDAAIISIFIGCGLRLGGLTAMNQSNLVFMEVNGQEWLVLRVIEKGDKERIIPVPHEARLLVRAYLGHPQLKMIDRTLLDGDQVLWVSVRNRNVPQHQYYGENRRLAERSIGQMIEDHAEAAGIPRDQAHPHALRHLFGTELTEDDIQQRKIQVLMGHSSSRSTETYQHVAVRSLMKAVQSANPLAKINTPTTDLLKHLNR